MTAMHTDSGQSERLRRPGAGRVRDEKILVINRQGPAGRGHGPRVARWSTMTGFTSFPARTRRSGSLPPGWPGGPPAGGRNPLF